jgi:hypothetical protein
MHIQTKFLRLRKPVALGDRIDDWRVCWLGGWDKCRVFFVVNGAERIRSTCRAWQRAYVPLRPSFSFGSP